VSTGNLTRRVERGRGSDWTCSYASAKGGAQVAFSVSVAKSAAEAAAEMERYRRSLGDDYSDLMGMGDEGVWTEASKTVTCRKKNVTVKVRQPPEKIPQLRIVKALFDKN
jgi:hypothetical protein